MIPNIDRLPAKPHRYAVYDDNHNFIRYEYHERADEPVVEGSLLNKAKLDEFLAASGETSGTASALTLAQPGFLLKDGATVRIKLHTDMVAGATLDVEGTGAKPIRTPTSGTYLAGTWLSLTYSSTTDEYATALMPIERELAASGVTAGSASALTLAQPGFTLFDGALIRCRLHVDMEAGATLDVNGTGAKAIKLSTLEEVGLGSYKAGVWVQLVYSSANDCYILQTHTEAAAEPVQAELDAHLADAVHLGKNEGAKIIRSTRQSIPSGYTRDVVFETAVFDRGNLFDASDKTKLTVPSDGIYLATATCEFASNKIGIRSSFFSVNGSTDYSHGMSEFDPVDFSITTLTFSAIYDLKQGDFIGVRAAQSSGDSLNITGSSLTLIKVG